MKCCEICEDDCEEFIMANFQRIKGTKIYEVVISQLKAKIVSGELAPGDFLPPEKTLAEIMGVSRASVREALKVLEFMGLIESKPGGGTSIVYVHADLLIEKLNMIELSQSNSLLLDLIELRELLEPKIVEYAIARATDTELTAIEEMLNNGEISDDEEVNAQNDALFHLAIARASHNVFFFRLMESTMAMLRETRARTLNTPGRKEKISEEHVELAKKIRSRDAAGATKAIRQHLM